MFRELTRKNKQLPMEDCIRILTEETRSVLSVNGDDGYPYAMPMNHFYNAEDGCIYFHCARFGYRLEALRRNDKVSLCVMDKGERVDGYWAWTVRSVIVFGRMEIIDELPVIEDVVRRLSLKFTQDEAYIEREIRQAGPVTLLLKLTPEHICGKWVVEE